VLLVQGARGGPVAMPRFALVSRFRMRLGMFRNRMVRRRMSGGVLCFRMRSRLVLRATPTCSYHQAPRQEPSHRCNQHQFRPRPFLIENLLASPGSVFVLPAMGSPIGYEQAARRRSALLFRVDSYCAAYMLCPTPPCPFSMRMETSLRQVLFRELSKRPELCPLPHRAGQAGLGGYKREFCEAL
jgi:hypothetical protein